MKDRTFMSGCTERDRWVPDEDSGVMCGIAVQGSGGSFDDPLVHRRHRDDRAPCQSPSTKAEGKETLKKNRSYRKTGIFAHCTMCTDLHQGLKVNSKQTQPHTNTCSMSSNHNNYNILTLCSRIRVTHGTLKTEMPCSPWVFLSFVSFRAQ